MFRIHDRMGDEIIQRMDDVLRRPGMQLICARYDDSPGAILAAYLSDQGDCFFLYWYKLSEEVKDPKKDAARLVAIWERKVSPDDFFQFLADPRTPVFKMSEDIGRIGQALSPDLALKLIEAGIIFERAASGVPAEG